MARARSMIHSPSDSGAEARNKENDKLNVIIIRDIIVILKVRDYYPILRFQRSLCILHQLSIVRRLISKYTCKGRFIQHLRSVSIRRRPQIQNGGQRRNGGQPLELNILKGIMSRLIHEVHESPLLRRRWFHIHYLRW